MLKMLFIFLMAANIVIDNSLEVGREGLISDEELSQQPQHIECRTPDCMEMGNKLKGRINFKADPCEDFYAYACGNFIETHNRGTHENEINSDVFDLNFQLKHLLEDVTSSQLSLPRPFRLLTEFYNVCKNRNYCHRPNNPATCDGSADFLKNVANLGNDWPTLLADHWNRNFKWMDKLLNLTRFGFNIDYLMKLSITLNPENVSGYMEIIIDHPSFILQKLPFNKGLNNRNVDAYYNLMLDVAAQFGANRTQAVRYLKYALRFEMELANITSKYERPDRSKYNLTQVTLEELKNISPFIDFNRLLYQYLASSINVSPLDGDTVQKSEEYREEPNRNGALIKTFIHDYDLFLEIIKLIDGTSPRTMANYILWQTIYQALPYINGELYELYQEFLNNITEHNQNPPTRNECVETTKQMLPVALGAYYAQRRFNNSMADDKSTLLNDMAKQIKNAYIDNIPLSNLMKNSAIEDINSTNFINGFPDDFYDNQKLSEYYKNLNNIHKRNYLLSILEVQKFNRGIFDSSLKLSSTSIAYKGIFSEIYENKIHLPGINMLHAIYHSSNRPNSMNYGVFGTMMGHDLYYSSIKKGTVMSKWNFILQNHHCLLRYYGKFEDEKFKKIPADGSGSVCNNMADVIGVKMAYTAYIEASRNNPTSELLPGLTNVTSNQLFWLSYANLFCENSNRSATSWRNMYSDHIHTPSRFRVLGPLMNLKSFASDFDCPANSNMISAVKKGKMIKS